MAIDVPKEAAFQPGIGGPSSGRSAMVDVTADHFSAYRAYQGWIFADT